MKSTWVVLICGFFILVSSGCSSTYKVPAARMLSPESEGHHSFTAQSGIHGNHEVTITTSIQNVSVTSSQHPVETRGTPGASFNYGILEHFDLGISADLSVTPIYSAKYQFLGDSKKTATEGNFSLAVFGGLGYDRAIDESDSDGLGAESGKIEREGSAIYQLGAILGYRFADEVLGLVGFSRSWQEIKGTHSRPNTATVGFEDHPVFSEIHIGAIITIVELGEGYFFLQPVFQRGLIRTFGMDSWRTAAMVDVGYRF